MYIGIIVRGNGAGANDVDKMIMHGNRNTLMRMLEKESKDIILSWGECVEVWEEVQKNGTSQMCPVAVLKQREILVKEDDNRIYTWWYVRDEDTYPSFLK